MGGLSALVSKAIFHYFLMKETIDKTTYFTGVFIMPSIRAGYTRNSG